MDVITKKRIVIHQEGKDPFVIEGDHYLFGRVDEHGRVLCIPSLPEVSDWYTGMMLIGRALEVGPVEPDTSLVFDVCITDYKTGRQREVRSHGLALLVFNEEEGVQTINTCIVGMGDTQLKKFHRLIQKVYEESVDAEQ